MALSSSRWSKSHLSSPLAGGLATGLLWSCFFTRSHDEFIRCFVGRAVSRPRKIGTERFAEGARGCAKCCAERIGMH
jgi:hypothetical protein